jgi:hypothetical protein
MESIMKQYMTALALAGTLMLGQVGFAAAQGNSTTVPNSGKGTPNSAGSINDPTSPASSNRGDPGTEPINPNTGGATMGQGQGARNPTNSPNPTAPSTPGGTQLPSSANPNGR